MTRTRALVLLSLQVAACEYHVVDRDRGDDPPGRHRALEEPSGTRPSSSDTREIARDKELLVVHRTVLTDSRARNDVAGAPFSFRTRMEEIAGGSDAATPLVFAWLDQWRTVSTVGSSRAPVTPRPDVESVLAAPWRAAGGGLDRAPFRLLAIVNRGDLRADADGCSGAAGELRFVYTAEHPETQRAVPMTVIVEIPYPTTRTPRQWTEAWHALGSESFGASYNERLAALTQEITRDSPTVGWRVRTNEIALGRARDLPWELREFAITRDSYGTTALAQVPLASTPRIELQGSAALDAWASENQDRIVTGGSFTLPAAFQAGAASLDQPRFRWDLPRALPDVREHFSRGTCNGCHGGERTAGDPLVFQHIAAPDQTLDGYYAPASDGETRISRWLDRGDDADELGRRAASTQRVLGARCGAAPRGYP